MFFQTLLLPSPQTSGHRSVEQDNLLPSPIKQKKNPDTKIAIWILSSSSLCCWILTVQFILFHKKNLDFCQETFSNIFSINALTQLSISKHFQKTEKIQKQFKHFATWLLTLKLFSKSLDMSHL
jgi:hypothetical protein